MMYRAAIIIIAALVSTSAHAQTRYPYSEFNYDYINTDSSYLIRCGNNVYLDVFMNKLESLVFEGNTQVRILHIGASHVQAGMWWWAVRKRLESMIPSIEGAPGYLFPFGIAKTNHPYFYKSTNSGNWLFQRITDKEIKHPLGVGGISAFTSDSIAEIQITFNDAAQIEQRRFDKLSVFHSANDDSFDVFLLPDSLVLQKTVDRASGTTVFYLRNSSDNVNLLFQKIEESDSLMYFFGVYAENQLPGIVYNGIGINGANTASYQKAELFGQQLCALEPDMVILSIGVNDAAGKNFSESQYEANYSRLIEMIRNQFPATAIILTTNTDFYNYGGAHNQNADAVKRAMLKNAETTGAAVYDLHAVMGGNRSITAWRNDGLAQKDRIHMTQEGYRILGILFAEAIQRDFENYLKRTYSPICTE